MEENIFIPDFSNKNINKESIKLSISKVLDLIKTPFEKRGVATKTYNNHFNNPESIYYKKTVDEIIEMWETKAQLSCKYGSLLDSYIGYNLNNDSDGLELFKLDNGYDWDERLKGICTSFDNFYKRLTQSGDIVFIAREKDVYHKVILNDKEYYIRGRFDALFYNKKLKKWILIDWKSNEDIKKSNKYQKLLGPCFQLDDCDYDRYTLQTHYYKKTLIEDGYLPEGITEDDIEVLIVVMPGHIINESNLDYEILKQKFIYNSLLMDNIFKFAIQKNNLLNKK